MDYPEATEPIYGNHNFHPESSENLVGCGGGGTQSQKDLTTRFPLL